MNSLIMITILFISMISMPEDDFLPSNVYHWAELKVEKQKTRERRQIMEGSTTALQYLEIHTSTLQPGMAPHPSHSHSDTEEMVIIKEGSLEVTINGKSRVLSVGSVFVNMPGDEHGMKNAGDGTATYYVFKYRSKAPMDVERDRRKGGSFMVGSDDSVFVANDNGERMQVINQATAMFKRFEMHITRLNAGLSSHKPHTHPAEEFILITKGNVKMQIGDKVYDATRGDLIFVESEIPHALNNSSDKQTEYFAFQWE